MNDALEIELIARGVLLAGDHILLCRNIQRGYTFLPGGHVEFGESASNALARELEEEAGLVAKIGRLLLVSEHVFRQNGRLRHEVNLVFHVEHSLSPSAPVVSREPKIAFDWVRRSDAERAGMRPASIARWVAALRTDPLPMEPIWISDLSE